MRTLSIIALSTALALSAARPCVGVEEYRGLRRLDEKSQE